MAKNFVQTTPIWNHGVLDIFDSDPFETLVTQTSATVKFMTGSYLVAKLKGRILIQLEHHFLHLYVDILFVTYKTRFNQSLQFQSTYQVQLFDRQFTTLGLESFESIELFLFDIMSFKK